MRVVRAYAQEEAEMAAFNNLNREYAERNLGLVRIDALMRPLMTFLIGIGFVLIIWAGVPLAVRGEITRRRVHDVQHVSDATDLAADRARIRRESLSARNGELETAERDLANRAVDCRCAGRDGATADQRQDRISQSDVQISSRTTNRCCSDINLTIPEGHTVAFVGRTGSGKSTMANLIPRLIEAPENTVFIDDVPIREVSAGATAIEHWLRAAGDIFVQRFGEGKHCFRS